MPHHAIDERPGLAIVANSLTPYGMNLYREVVAGVPELKVHVLVTHAAADFKWNVDVPRELTVKRFGAAGESPLENPLRRPLWDWRKGGRIIRYIRENRIRAVIVNGYRFLSLLRLMNFCYSVGVPFFVNNDSNIRNEPRLSLLASLTKRSIYAWWIKRSAGVMSMGRLGDQFFMKYGARSDRLYRVPCWPDFDAFARVDEGHLARFRQQFQLDEHRRYLLYAGRLVPHKRVDLLIDAFAAIASQRPNWDLLIVGDGVLRDELHRRIPDSLQSRVKWTGFLDGQEPALAYHAADVLVLPSDYEPWALVVQEAMAAGLTVVSSDVSGAAHELIEDCRSGRIFPTGDLERLKTALLDVTADEAIPIYKRESRAALARWRNEVNLVAEIRRALSDAGVLSPATQQTSPASPSLAGRG